MGDRAGDLPNTYDVPSYLRTDAAIFYNRDRFRIGLNFKNLFDVEYFENTYFGGHVGYGQPFTVQGTVSWQFMSLLITRAMPAATEGIALKLKPNIAFK